MDVGRGSSASGRLGFSGGGGVSGQAGMTRACSWPGRRPCRECLARSTLNASGVPETLLSPHFFGFTNSIHKQFTELFWLVIKKLIPVVFFMFSWRRFLRQLKLCSQLADVGVIDIILFGKFQSPGYLSLSSIWKTSLNVMMVFRRPSFVLIV